MTAKYSHIATDELNRYKIRTLCGKYVSGMNLGAIYTEGYEPKHWTRAPLCPKCAALRLIAETVTAR